MPTEENAIWKRLGLLVSVGTLVGLILGGMAQGIIFSLTAGKKVGAIEHEIQSRPTRMEMSDSLHDIEEDFSSRVELMRDAFADHAEVQARELGGIAANQDAMKNDLAEIKVLLRNSGH